MTDVWEDRRRAWWGLWAASGNDLPPEEEARCEGEAREQELAPGPERQRQVEAEVIRLYDEHAESLFRYASYALSEAEAAQDAVHDCFLQYFRFRIGGYRVGDARAWLMRAMRNRVKAGWVRKERMERIDPESLPRQSAESGPEDLTRLGELERMLPGLLSPREMECLRLRAEGLRYEEIGDVMHISSGTVGALINRAYKKLQRAFGFGGREDGS